jgi:hypothetical protein
VRQYVSDSHDDRKTMGDLRRPAMPLTAKGEEIRKHLEQEYGAKKGEQVLYAGKNKGTFTGIDADETKGEQSSEDARMSAIEGRLSEVEGKNDSIPAGLDPAKLDAACSMMDALDKRCDAFFSRGDTEPSERKFAVHFKVNKGTGTKDEPVEALRIEAKGKSKKEATEQAKHTVESRGLKVVKVSDVIEIM